MKYNILSFSFTFNLVAALGPEKLETLFQNSLAQFQDKSSVVTDDDLLKHQDEIELSQEAETVINILNGIQNPEDVSEPDLRSAVFAPNQGNEMIHYCVF